ncbi:hypothetical protein KXR53_12385 [Inquilinus limosus]|uniref:hypothetical protein n=1 Tax=Inquilinus limosus TaxID=171674 RepID=UPI003F165AD6
MALWERHRRHAPAWVIWAAACLGPAAASAHDSWISRGGYVEYGTTNHCCGEKDCTTWPRADIEESDDGYRIRSTGEFVPRFKSQSSEDGDYWICRKSTNAIRCFFAPSPGA